MFVEDRNDDFIFEDDEEEKVDPYRKIREYIEKQRKMPHVATNIALKEITWPPKSKKTQADNLPPLEETFPDTSKRERSEGGQESRDESGPSPEEDSSEAGGDAKGEQS